ncbi:TPA: hypothetical protein NHQ80_003418 [Pseudomonas aeruginosa]|uniref:phage adaptor protein n=1 Tax=Pseudomonas aeruginosa TaxID=287 RepID=UPI0004056016|nr:packaged DNA stabilization gp4 family protein [Pseudomonas aeruginosa]EIZ7652643.1 hypothetical protein [Pseudomonas aeruginosa]EKM7584988.1 hypothetical protein [Pseudomonas aeruginosa]EKV6516385.1 hypothetical protein [Pseudomonas aeruginosa]EKW5131432.1 hypothetical protein [Pseudomonas aeruginosa]ELE6507042.1 hypothetical protein [Pseudomonas aeruginosa]
MTTPNDLIILALKQANVLGVGQSASAEDIQDCFALLNMMLAQWNRRRYAIYHLKTVSIACDGSQSYTIGPGGDIDTTRPNKIESAYFRQIITSEPNQIDYPLEIIRAREDYDRIYLKDMQSFPQYLFYDSDYPLGNVFVWPIPDNQYRLFLTVMEPLQVFSTVYDEIELPPEYQEAIMYNLALRIYPMYGLPVNDAVVQLAKASMNILEASNVQVPRLKVPGSLTRGGVYNPYADRVR